MTETLPEKWPPDEWKPHLQEVGRLVFHWNTVEQMTESLLTVILGRTAPVWILSAHMGSVPMCDALRTAANEFEEGPALDHILNALKGIEIMREYRNYYVHGFGNIGISVDGLPTALLRTRSARSRLADHDLWITVADVQQSARECQKLAHYMAEIHLHIAERKQWPDKTPHALPGTLPLPDKLQKPRRFRLDEEPPPQSSEA